MRALETLQNAVFHYILQWHAAKCIITYQSIDIMNYMYRYLDYNITRRGTSFKLCFWGPKINCLATFFRSLDRTIYLIMKQLRIVRILTAFCMPSLCLAQSKWLDSERWSFRFHPSLQPSRWKSLKFKVAEHKQRVKKAVRILTMRSCIIIK
jgi:hypothetical protein